MKIFLFLDYWTNSFYISWKIKYGSPRHKVRKKYLVINLSDKDFNRHMKLTIQDRKKKLYTNNKLNLNYKLVRL